MVHPDPSSRPSSSKLLVNPTLNPSINKSRSQLYKELKAARDKVARLELQIVNSSTKKLDTFSNKENAAPKLTGKRLVGRGTAKSSSCVM